MHQTGAPMIPQQGMQGPPRFGQTQSQWAGQPRQSGPRPALLNGPPQRPQMVNYDAMRAKNCGSYLFIKINWWLI